MSNTAKTSDQLIEECQDLVRSLAWKIRAGLPDNVDINDLIGYGQVGLSEAAQAYDPARGVKFSTFAYYRVRGAIYDGLTMMSWFRQSPRSDVKYQQMANEVLEAENTEQSSTEGSSLKDDVDWFKQITGSLAIAYLASSRTGEDEEPLQIVDHSSPSPQAVVCGEEVRRKLQELVDALPGQEGVLIRAAYYEGLSLKDAAKRLGISKSWASRLHAKTLKRLANSLQDLGMVD